MARAERETIVSEYARKARVPGFRPGKAPRTVVEKRFSKQISEELNEKLINEAFDEALRKEELRVLDFGAPRDVTELPDGGMLMTNFVDFDMLYGHRRNVSGYAAALEAFDRYAGTCLLTLLTLAGRFALAGAYTTTDLQLAFVRSCFWFNFIQFHRSFPLSGSLELSRILNFYKVTDFSNHAAHRWCIFQCACAVHFVQAQANQCCALIALTTNR